MSSTSSTLPVQQHILCYYLNPSSQMQIARIANSPDWYFERVIFPGQRLMFNALPEAILEIHPTSETCHIHCKCLCVSDFSANLNDD